MGTYVGDDVSRRLNLDTSTNGETGTSGVLGVPGQFLQESVVLAGGWKPKGHMGVTDTEVGEENIR